MKVKLKRAFNFRLIKDCNEDTIGEITYIVGGIPETILLFGKDKAKIHTEIDIRIPANMQIMIKEKTGLGHEVAIIPKEEK